MRVVAFVLAHNQDLWIEHVIRSVVNSVDELVVLHHASTDRTAEKIEQAIHSHSHARAVVFPDLSEGHSHVSPYAGGDWWAWQIDGDELYDSAGLHRLAQQCRDGHFDDIWRIHGRYIHALEYKTEEVEFRGHLHPPDKKCGANFYNLSHLERWPCDRKRVAFMSHGMAWKRGRTPGARDTKNQKCDWANSLMRCVHLRFLQQSSIEPDHEVGNRLSPQQVLGWGLNAKETGGKSVNMRNSYREGPIVTVDAAPFLGK